MSAPAGAPRELFSRTSEGPQLRACAELDRRAPALTAALRRAFPFMVRRGVPVVPEPASSSSLRALEATTAQPRYLIHVETDPGSLRGALLFDATAVALVFDGALGGGAAEPPSLGEGDLTNMQLALVARNASAVVPALSAVLEGASGFGLRKLSSAEEALGEDELVTLQWRLGPKGAWGNVVLALDRAALLGAPVAGTGAGSGEVAPAVVAALGAVELELVAELGRVRLTLGELSALRVGHALCVPVSVGSAVAVRVEGRLLFEGHPTTAGTRVAIRVAGGTSLDAAVVHSQRKEVTP